MRFCKSKEHDFKNICSVERADYTFVSIGPGWIDKEMMKENFQYIHENYQERLTFITTNAVNIHQILKIYRNQYVIRRIRKS